MPRGNRGIFAAPLFGLIAFSAIGGFVLASGQRQSEHQQAIGGQTGSGYFGDQPPQSAIERAGLPRLVERTISNPQPKSGTDQEKRDLAAQEATAAFTFWMVLVAILQTIVAGIGILYIRLTIKQARDTAYIELRAYLYPGFFKIERLSNSRWQCEVPLINGGSTPARNVRTHFEAKVAPYPLTPESFWNVDIGGIMYMALGPHSERMVRTWVTIKADQTDAINAGDACILARFQVAYTTYRGEEIEEAVSTIFARIGDMNEGKMRIVSPRQEERMARNEGGAAS